MDGIVTAMNFDQLLGLLFALEAICTGMHWFSHFSITEKQGSLRNSSKLIAWLMFLLAVGILSVCVAVGVNMYGSLAAPATSISTAEYQSRVIWVGYSAYFILYGAAYIYIFLSANPSVRSAASSTIKALLIAHGAIACILVIMKLSYSHL